MLALVHLAATAYMTGIIWFVQTMHYPWFHKVPVEQFREYHAGYTARMGWVVGPVMLVELITGLMLVWTRGGLVFGLNMAGMAVLWGSTFLLQVPCHHRLSGGYDAVTHERLVNTNWIRTVVWSIRLVLLIGTL